MANSVPLLQSFGFHSVRAHAQITPGTWSKRASPCMMTILQTFCNTSKTTSRTLSTSLCSPSETRGGSKCTEPRLCDKRTHVASSAYAYSCSSYGMSLSDVDCSPPGTRNAGPVSMIAVAHFTARSTTGEISISNDRDPRSAQAFPPTSSIARKATQHYIMTTTLYSYAEHTTLIAAHVNACAFEFDILSTRDIPIFATPVATRSQWVRVYRGA